MQDSNQRAQSRSLLITIVVAIIVLAASLAIFINLNAQRVSEQNSEYLKTSTEQTARRINDVFSNALRTTQLAARTYGSLEEMNNSVQSTLDLFDLSQFDNTFYINAAGVAFDNDGRVATAENREYFIKGMQGEPGVCFISDSIFDGQNVIVFYAPIQTNSETTGVMASVYREDTLTRLITTQFYDYTTPTSLCMPDGTVIAKAGYDTNVTDIDEVFNDENLIGTDVATVDNSIENGLSVGFNYRDSEGIASAFVAQLSSFDWVVVRSFPTSITNQTIASANLAGVVIIAGVAIAVLLIGAVLLKRVRTKNKTLLLERQKANRVIDATTNLFASMFTIDLVNERYEFLKNSTDQTQIPLEGSYSTLCSTLDQMIDKELSKIDTLTFLNKTRLQALLNSNVPYFQEEWHSGGKSSNARWYQASTICLSRNESGQPTSVLIAVQDITKTKRREQQSRMALEEAYRAAEHASQAKSSFLSSMSHDIRTPMNSIMGLTTIANMHMDDPKRVQECLNNITAASKHLLSLINEVLDVAKIESGSVSLAEDDFDLPSIIENLTTIINPQVTAKHQELKIETTNLKHEHVIGDSTRLQQIFTNIMGNSVKFTPEGGTISLSITELPSAVDNTGCYKFVFSDTGCGMSKEFLEHIFEPFSREDDPRISKTEGTGLGLAIVKSIVELMNGSIDVTSEEGVGSTFTIIIHLKLREEEEQDITELKDSHILIIDDDIITCESGCALLSDIGMRSEYALSGPKGIEAVKEAEEIEDPYRAIILDWCMPEMSGIETAVHIREITGTRVPIIILSAYSWSQIEQEPGAGGIDAYISKPLFRSSLIRVLKKHLGAEELPDRNEQKESLEDLQLEGKRVLLTEDNPMAAAIAQEFLEMTGATVEHAENGKFAVDMLSEHEPNYYSIVFMDIQMPIMNGYEATEAIRALADKRPDLGEIPIVALSADAFIDDVRRSKKVGMNDHISKPLELDALINILHKWVK